MFLWSKEGRKRPSELLALSNVHLVSILSRHNPIGSHVVKLNILSNANCTAEGEVKPSRHHSLNCPALVSMRLKHFGSQTFGKVAKIDKKILVGSKLFIDL